MFGSCLSGKVLYIRPRVVKFHSPKIHFSDALGTISIGLAIMPIIAFLSLISLGKNFAKKNHYQAWGSCT